MYRASLQPGQEAIRRVVVLLCALAGFVWPNLSAAAADAQATKVELGNRYGVVWRIRGEVAAEPPSAGSSRRLKEGDPVFVGEHVRAAQNAEAVLKTDDAGAIAIRPGTEFVAERFVAAGEPTDSLTLRLVVGSLRVVTGWIGRINPAEDRVITPSAAIGIRGTDHEPYVLSVNMAAATPYKPGTYDKVNRGATILEAQGKSLDIDAGRVGFARYSSGLRERALMTILLPVLLDKVPDFYVPGQFDGEIDRFSATADKTSLEQLERKRHGGAAAAPACAPAGIAKDWIDQLDRGIARRDAKRIVALFAPDVVVRATVIGMDGASTAIDLSREELAESTLNAVKSLKGYKQRRISLDAEVVDASEGAACKRISVKSVVIEQGQQAGKPFRFEAQEDYVLERRDSKWLAVKAETTQR